MLKKFLIDVDGVLTTGQFYTQKKEKYSRYLDHMIQMGLS